MRVAGAEIHPQKNATTKFRFAIAPPTAAAEALPKLVLPAELERVGRLLLLEASEQKHLHTWVETLRQAAEM